MRWYRHCALVMLSQSWTIIDSLRFTTLYSVRGFVLQRSIYKYVKTIIAILFCFVLLQLTYFYYDVYTFEKKDFKLARVAHAGGGYLGKTYTNSLDALTANIKSFELFEIDLEWTSDKHLVCMHDWEESAAASFGKSFSSPPSLEEFQKLVDQQTAFKNCTFETLMVWLNQNPSKKIITDIKTDNVAALSWIAKHYPSHIQRFIPQIYQREEYKAVKDLGYKDIIFTFYKFRGENNAIIASIDGMSLYAVTVSKRKLKTKFEHFLESVKAPIFPPYLIRKLTALNVPVYVHTVNDHQEWSRYQRSGVTEIYTDWLEPHAE